MLKLKPNEMIGRNIPSGAEVIRHICNQSTCNRKVKVQGVEIAFRPFSGAELPTQNGTKSPINGPVPTKVAPRGKPKLQVNFIAAFYK